MHVAKSLSQIFIDDRSVADVAVLDAITAVTICPVRNLPEHQPQAPPVEVAFIWTSSTDVDLLSTSDARSIRSISTSSPALVHATPPSWTLNRSPPPLASPAA